MKTLLAFLIILGAGGWYIMQVRNENEQMKAKMDEMSKYLSDDQKASMTGAKPLYQQQVRGLGPMVHKKVICPECKGEGAVMVRREFNGSVSDVKTMCALCMGTGKRELDMPAKAEICSDCGGMGKRVIIHMSPQATGYNAGGQNSKLDGTFGVRDGFDHQAPTTTSCPRCLGKGYIIRPGLQ